MALSNTATPIYYGRFREDVIKGKIPVNKEVSLEMNRIDELIANPGIYYDDQAVEGWIKYCETELTLTDGTDLHLLDSFKLWGEQVFGVVDVVVLLQLLKRKKPQRKIKRKFQRCQIVNLEKKLTVYKWNSNIQSSHHEM